MSTAYMPNQSRRRSKIGALGAALTLAAAVVPADAGAVIVPREVKPQAVTPYVVPSSTPPSAAASPAAATGAGQSFGQGSAPSAPAVPSPAPSSAAGPTAAPNPALLADEPPPYKEDDFTCELYCKQVLYLYYVNRAGLAEVVVKDVQVQTPWNEEDAINAAEALKEKVSALAKEIRDAGGTPGQRVEPEELPPDAVGGPSPSRSDPQPAQGTDDSNELPGRLLAALVNGVAQKDVVQFKGGRLSPVGQANGTGPGPNPGPTAGPGRGSDATGNGADADAEAILGAVEDLFGIDGGSSSGSNGLHQLEQPQSAD